MGAWGVLMNVRRRGLKRTLEIRHERDVARKDYQEYLASSGKTQEADAGKKRQK